MPKPTVLGIPSPWDGNETQPTPWTYKPWYWAYKTIRQSKHRIGFCDKDGRFPDRCDWCGKAYT